MALADIPRPPATSLRTSVKRFQPENMNTFTDRHGLEEKVKQHKRVLVLFCASWCPFCQNFFATFDRLATKQSFEKRLRVYIDDEDNQLWEDYSIEAVPTVILFEQGRVTRRLNSGLGSGLREEAFSDWLKEN